MSALEISTAALQLDQADQSAVLIGNGHILPLRLDHKQPSLFVTDVEESSDSTSGDEACSDIVIVQHGLVVPELKESFFDILEHALLDFGNHVAATDAASGQSIRYDELRHRSECLGRALRQHSLRPVGLCTQPSLDFLIAIVSLARQGMTYVALDPSLPEDRARHIVRDSGIEAVLCSSQYAGLPRFEGLDVLDISNVLGQVMADENTPVTKLCSDAAIAILYTSGSSGTPKGVVLPYRALLNRLSWQWRTNPFANNDVVAAKTKMGFGDSLAETWAPLLAGVSLVYMSPTIITNPSLFLNALEQYRASLLIVVPSLLQVLLHVIQNEKRELRSLRQVVSSGESLTMEHCELFFRILPQCKLANYYGATETMADVTGTVFSSLEDVTKSSYKNQVAAGKVVDNSTIFLHACNEDGVGELIVTGENLAAGYIPSSNEKKFIRAAELADYPDRIPKDQICFRTGDRGKFHDGNLVLLGRTDRQVKLAGNRIDLYEVETIISSSLVFMIQPIVLAHNGQLLAFYEEYETPDWHAGLNKIMRWLPAHAVPRFIPVTRIPHLDISGKVDQRALIAQLNEQGFREIHSVLQQDRSIQQASILSEAENQNLEALIQALRDAGLDCPEPTELLAISFFQIGGTSLNALLVLHKLHQQGFCVSLEDFFSATNFRDMIRLSPVDLGKQAIDRETALNAKANDQIYHDRGWTFTSIDLTNLEEAVILLGANFVNEQLTMFRTEDFEANKSRLQEEATIMFRAQLEYFVRHRKEEHVSFGLCDSEGRLVAVSLSYAEDFSLKAKGALLDRASLLIKGPLVAKSLALFADDPLVLKGLLNAKSMLAINGSISTEGVEWSKTSLLTESSVLSKGSLMAKAKAAAFLDRIQSSVVSELKLNGHSNILFGLATAVDHNLVPDPAARVQAMMALERHVLKSALDKGYDTVFSINTSPLTQDAADLLGYKTARVIGNLRSVQDEAGRSAFPSATDDAVVKVQYKALKRRIGVQIHDPE